MKRVILLISIFSILSSTLFASQLVTNKRLLNIVKKLGYDAKNKDLKSNKTVLITTKDGDFIFFDVKNSRVSLTTMFIPKENKNILEKINEFNKNILFCSAFSYKDKVGLNANLNALDGASDEKIISFLSKFLVIRKHFIKFFK